MFEDIDRIDWGKLTHAYGSAADVPGLIRALASDNKRARKNALHALYGNIWHQGTVYEATAYAVPFLVEILRAPTGPDKYNILYLLSDLAHGYPYMDVHLPAMPTDEKGDPRTDELWAQRLRERNWVVDAHDAVSRYYSDYLGFLTDDDEKTRMMAGVLLGGLPAVREQVFPYVQERLTEETSLPVRATILYFVPDLAEGQEQTGIDLLLPYLSVENEPILCFCAAAALARLAREAIPESALDVLVDALRKDQTLERQYRALYWLDTDIPVIVGEVLCSIGPEGAAPVVPKLCRALESLGWISSTELARPLMYLAFGTEKLKEGTIARDLTDLQRQTLAAICDHALVMSGSSSVIANVGNLLYAYGLPGSPDRLREFLQS